MIRCGWRKNKQTDLEPRIWGNKIKKMWRYNCFLKPKVLCPHRAVFWEHFFVSVFNEKKVHVVTFSRLEKRSSFWSLCVPSALSSTFSGHSARKIRYTVWTQSLSLGVNKGPVAIESRTFECNIIPEGTSYPSPLFSCNVKAKTCWSTNWSLIFITTMEVSACLSSFLTSIHPIDCTLGRCIVEDQRSQERRTRGSLEIPEDNKSMWASDMSSVSVDIELVC